MLLLGRKCLSLSLALFMVFPHPFPCLTHVPSPPPFPPSLCPPPFSRGGQVMPLRHLPPQRARVHTQALTHRHTRLGTDAFQCRIYQKPHFRHQIAVNPRTELCTLAWPPMSHTLHLSPNRGSRRASARDVPCTQCVYTNNSQRRNNEVTFWIS